MPVVGPFSEALRSTIQPCTFLLLAPVMLVVIAARVRLQAVIAAFGAGVLGGWVFADNTFVLDGWWLRLSALVVTGIFVALTVPTLTQRLALTRGTQPQDRTDDDPASTAFGAAASGIVALVATQWWRPCVGNELGTILTASQDGIGGEMIPMAIYMVGALAPVAIVALAHRAWQPRALVTKRLGWSALGLMVVIGGSILAGRHDQLVVTLTRWTLSG